MHAHRVLETLDVGKHTATCFLFCIEAAAVRLLHLQNVPEALHRRIVVTVARATHRLPVAVVLQMRM